MAIEFRHQVLFRSNILAVVDIRWHAHDPRPTIEFDSPAPEVTFMRTGMFVRRHGHRGVVCDPNTLLFINVDEPYRMTHPVEMRCACTALLIDLAVLRELVGERNPAAADRGDRLFTFDSCPCMPEAMVEHFDLFTKAKASEDVDPLAVEEAGLALARRAVSAACRFNDGRTGRRRASTDRAHADLTEAVKEIVAARYPQRQSLAQISAAVHAAPNHLCTVFKAQTGFSIHQYLTRFRLAAALEALAERPRPLAELARDLGFCHHSHFSTAFRRTFGRPPSEAIRRLRPASMTRIRKNLQA